jgi:ribosomal 30S subunit maturation factor RimM
VLRGYIAGPAHDVMKVQDGNNEILIPWVLNVFVKNIQQDNKQIIVEWGIDA